MNRLLLSLAIIPTLLSTACGTYIRVQSTRPGIVNVGAAKSLVMLDGEGRRSAKELVVQEFTARARETGYFQVVDNTASGITLAIAGNVATVNNASEALPMGFAYLKLDVLEWSGDKATETKTDSKGNRSTVTTTTGTAVIGVTLVDPRGTAIIAEKDYEGTASSTSLDKDAVIEAASKNAIAKLIQDITPVNVSSSVRVDTDDKSQKTIIATAKAGNYGQAIADLQAYIQANPNSGEAFYNMALFMDAMGNYGEALGAYDRAIQLSGGAKSFYTESRAACARRMSEAEALQQ